MFVKEDYAIDLHSSGEIGLAENVRLHLLTNSPEAAILMRPNSRINKIEQMEIHTNSASLSGPYGIQFETFSSQLGSIGDIFGLTYFGGSFAQQVGEICPLLFDTNGMNVDLFVQGSIEDIGCVLK